MSNVRHGGKVIGAATALGAMGLGVSDLTNFWFRFPNVADVLTSPWFLAYLIFSFLIGMAVTYYFDNEADAKAHAILRAALRVAGAACVAYATQQLWEVAAVCVAALFVSLWLLPRGLTARAIAVAAPDTAAAAVNVQSHYLPGA